MMAVGAVERDPSPDPGAPRPSMRSNVRWTLLGSVASAAGNWLLVIVLARASGSAAVGAYAYALALTAPVIGAGSFMGLQLRTLIGSDPNRRFAFHEYRSASLAGNGLGLAAMAAILLVAGSGGGGWQVMVPMLAMRLMETTCDTYYGLWQLHERMRPLAIARVLQGSVALACALAAAALGAGPAGTAVAGATGVLASLAYMHAASVRDPEIRAAALSRDPPLEPARILRIVLQGVPLGFIILLGVLQANIPRYFVEAHAGTAALGFFVAASQLTTAGNMVVSAVGSAALPRLASWYAAGDHAFWKTSRNLALGALALGGAGFAISALAGREILALVYGAEFGSAADALVVLSIAASLAFVSSLLGHALTAARIITPQPVVLAASLAVLALSSLWLVPRHAEVGAAWALAAACFVQATASYVLLRRASPRGAPRLRRA